MSDPILHPILDPILAPQKPRNEAFDFVPRHRARWATSLLGGAHCSRSSGVVGGGGGGRDSHCYFVGGVGAWWRVRFEMIERFLEKQTTNSKINCRRKTRRSFT